MKKIIYITAAAILLTVILNECSDPSEKSKDAGAEPMAQGNEVAKKDNANVKSDSLTDFQVFKNSSMEKIKENEKKISQVQAEIEKQEGKARLEFEKTRHDLEKQNRKLEEKLDKLQEDAKLSWDSLKLEINQGLAEFNHDMEGLGKSLEDFTKKNNKK